MIARRVHCRALYPITIIVSTILSTNVSSYEKDKKGHSTIISVFSLMLISSSIGTVSTQFVNGQANQVNSDRNNANSLDV
jgi:hypothetical protein